MMALGDPTVNNFEPRLLELSPLAVAASYDVPRMEFAHRRNGMLAGFTAEQVDAAIAGNVPEGLGCLRGGDVQSKLGACGCEGSAR